MISCWTAQTVVLFGVYFVAGCSLNIVFLPLNFVIFLNSASSAAALVFYMPALCTQTDTEGKQSSEYFEKFGEKKHNI